MMYHYVDDKRKSKSYPTGVLAEASSQRKAKQQEREALAIKDRVLQEFLIADNPAEELFTATAKAWLKQQEGQKEVSTLASYYKKDNAVNLMSSGILGKRTDSEGKGEF